MTFDSNIIIAYLGGDESVTKKLSEWYQERRTFFLPTVVEAEILSFAKWEDAERFITERFLAENFRTVPLDRVIARIAAKIRRQTKIKLPDAIIAATAIFTNTPLVTRNLADFRKIPNLALEPI